MAKFKGELFEIKAREYVMMINEKKTRHVVMEGINKKELNTLAMMFANDEYGASKISRGKTNLKGK